MICEPNVRDGVSKDTGPGKDETIAAFYTTLRGVSQLKSRPQSRHRNDTWCQLLYRAQRSSFVLHPSIPGPFHPPRYP